MTKLAPFHRSSTVLEGGKTSPVFPTAKQVFVPAHATSASWPTPLVGVALGTIAQLLPFHRSTNGVMLPDEPSRPAAKQLVADMHATPPSTPNVPPAPEGVGLGTIFHGDGDPTFTG